MCKCKRCNSVVRMRLTIQGSIPDWSKIFVIFVKRFRLPLGQTQSITEWERGLKWQSRKADH